MADIPLQSLSARVSASGWSWFLALRMSPPPQGLPFCSVALIKPTPVDGISTVCPLLNSVPL